MNQHLRKTLYTMLGLWLSLISHTAFAQSTTQPGTMEMKPFQEPAYKQAMAIDHPEPLLNSLKRATEQKRLVKMPVVIRTTVDGWGQWHHAYIGTDTAATDPIEIVLNDAALGVSLTDRIRQYCPSGGTCKLWLVGYWDDRMVRTDECSPAMKRRQLQLSIRHVVGPQADGDAAVVFVAKQ